MNIYDMFSENKEILLAKGITLNEYSIEKDTSQYLLYTLASGKLQTKRRISLNAKSYPIFGILYVLNESVTYTQNNKPETAAVYKNSLLIFDCRTSHILSCKENSQFILIYFDGYPAKYYCDQLFVNKPFIQTTCVNELYLKLQNLLNISTLDNLQANLLLTDFLTHIVLQTTTKTALIPNYLLQIKELFDTNYYIEHTLEELEKNYHITRYRICREFKLYFHNSPIQYLHQIRMQNAQLLLQEGILKIHEIAYEVGYENVNQFIHHFKKTAGTTPAAYRKRLFTP